MNFIDIVIGILLIIAAIMGYKKGFIYELASLAALILGIWGAVIFSDFVASYIKQSLSWDFEYMNLAAFLITFVAIVGIIHFVGILLNKLIDAVSLGFLNHVAGSVFGLLKAAFVVSILLFAYEKFDPQGTVISNQYRNKSKVYEPIRSFAPSILPFMKNFDKKEDPKKENEIASDTIIFKYSNDELC